MGRRRKQNGIDVVAGMPWPVGVATGLIGFLLVRYGVAGWISHQGGPLAQGFNQGIGAMLAPLAWMVLAVCWIGAVASFARSRHRRKLLDTRTDLESLSQGGWRQFELLVGEAFRRQGYMVEETGLGGADGGIDLILRKQGRRTLVQCKQWKRQQIGVSVVRGMAGLLAHHHAHAVKIVCIGAYTKDAVRFAHGKPIELMSGARLLQMIHAEQRKATSAYMPQQARVELVLPRVETVVAPVATTACPPLQQRVGTADKPEDGEGVLGLQSVPELPRARLIEPAHASRLPGYLEPWAMPVAVGETQVQTIAAANELQAQGKDANWTRRGGANGTAIG